MSTRALVRRPGPRLADGLVTHIPRTSVDGDLAVISRPGADARRPEITGTEETLAALGGRTSPGASSSPHCSLRWAPRWWACPSPACCTSSPASRRCPTAR